MGLDMYMYEIGKLDESEVIPLVGAKTNDIKERYHYIDKETFDADPDMYGDLIPYITEIPVIDTAFDYKSCFANYGINEEDMVTGSFCSNQEVGWSFISGAHIKIAQDEYESYLYEQEILVYVFKSREVAYWRKNYDLDDFLQNLRLICRTKQMIDEEGRPPEDEDINGWQTENCGYYMLSVEEKNALKQYLNDRKKADEDHGDYSFDWSELLDDEESVLMYHAWW